jgi:CRISPR-associated endonuclease/helicase Cas3
VVALKICNGGYSFIDSNKDISNDINNSEIARKIASSTLRLPLKFSMYGNADKTIKELEKYNLKYLSEWQNQAWLKGGLGIIFDKNGDFELANNTLHYDRRYGLTYREEGFNE